MNPETESRAPRLMVVAGEASGDQIAALAVRELLRLRPDCEVFGVGGPALVAAGLRADLPMERFAVMGLVDVLKDLPGVLGGLSRLTALARRERPDVLLLVDAPGLNVRLAKRLQRLRREGTRIVYYISPKYWAWKRGRLKAVARLTDHQALIFPFEEADYRAVGGAPVYVGHPVFDLAEGRPGRAESRRLLGLGPSGPVVALLPGSRLGELKRHLPLLADCATMLADHEAKTILQLPEHLPERVVDPLLKGLGSTRVVRGHYHELLAAADVALVASGTASLEAAAKGLPHHVFYRLDPLAWALARRFVRVRWVSPVNLAANEELVPESLGEDARGVRLANWIAGRLRRPRELADEGRLLVRRMREVFGEPGASRRVAELVATLLPGGDGR